MPKKKLIATITILLTLLALASIAWFFPAFGAPKNYAKQTAEPIEAALMKAGAVKKCEDGDAGRGSDNIEPWYGAVFEVSKNKAEAILLANQAALENGYSLTHATPTNRGFLGTVDDAYIDDWYFNDTSRDSPYGELAQGKVKLSVVAYGEGQQNDCDRSTIQPNYSTIGIGVSLPYYQK